MSRSAEYRVIDGIKCYHPDVAEDYGSYPTIGFDITDEVEEGSFWVWSRTRLLRREILQLTAPLERAKVLEIGCGTGVFLQSLADEPNLELLGSEIYLRGLKSARARNSSVEYVQLDASDIPFEAEFDVVGAFDVIEHIDDDISVLRGIYQALKPGGHALITVPQHQFLWSSLDELVHHKRRYGRKELMDKARQAGLEVRFVSSFLFMLFPLMLLSRLLDRGRGQESETQALDRRVRFSGWVNAVFDAFMRLDEAMIGWRWSLPWGGSLLLLARKRD